MQHRFLVHDRGDDVGVAVADIKTDEAVRGVVLADGTTIELRAKSDIPLGHKVALRMIDAGASVVEYGIQIGVATGRIGKGEHVHVHNLRSARW